MTGDYWRACGRLVQNSPVGGILLSPLWITGGLLLGVLSLLLYPLIPRDQVPARTKNRDEEYVPTEWHEGDPVARGGKLVNIIARDENSDAYLTDATSTRDILPNNLYRQPGVKTIFNFKGRGVVVNADPNAEWSDFKWKPVKGKIPPAILEILPRDFS